MFLPFQKKHCNYLSIQYGENRRWIMGRKQNVDSISYIHSRASPIEWLTIYHFQFYTLALYIKILKKITNFNESKKIIILSIIWAITFQRV